MTFETFLLIQRQRAETVDGTEEDRRIRSLRFRNAKGGTTLRPEPYSTDAIGAYDAIKAGYRVSKLIYE